MIPTEPVRRNLDVYEVINSAVLETLFIWLSSVSSVWYYWWFWQCHMFCALVISFAICKFHHLSSSHLWCSLILQCNRQTTIVQAAKTWYSTGVGGEHSTFVGKYLPRGFSKVGSRVFLWKIRGLGNENLGNLCLESWNFGQKQGWNYKICLKMGDTRAAHWW